IKEKIIIIDKLLENCQLQAALREAIELSRIGNRYLNEKRPWDEVKSNPQMAANTIYVSAQIVKALSVILEPFMPITARKLRKMLNLPEKVSWDDAYVPLPPGHKVKGAEPLFTKISASESDMQNMLERIRERAEEVSYEDFSKIDIRVGRIVEAEIVPGSKNLLKLSIDVGGALKTALAGIAKYYRPEDLRGKYVAVVVNLKPKKVFGIESEAMILAAEDEDKVVIIGPEAPIKTGSKVR
ncbi:MAG: methionine--tRNA ligase subunit beta, partial [Thermoproteota archaeon]